MKTFLAGRSVRIAIFLALAGGAFLYWRSLQEPDLPDGFAKSNGRIEDLK